MHDHVLPHPDVSHPEFFPPIFHSDISYPEFFLVQHSIRMSHIRNYIRSTFHLLRISHIRNSVRRRSTFSGYLTSGILSGRRSTFFFILRAFSLGSKITFLIKFCCHFYFWQVIFILPLFFKMFWNKQGINSVQWSYWNWFRQDKTGFGGGPTYEIWLTWLSYMIDLFCSMTCMRLFFNCSLTLFHDSALSFATQVRIRSYSGYFLYIFCFSYVHDSIWVFIDVLINCHVSFILLVETRL